MFRPVLIAALAVAAAAAPAAAMGSRRATENDLSAAGFKVRVADTPERQAMLARLPAHKVLMRNHDGTVHYVYADPQGCNCIYVGSEDAYQKYAAAKQAQHIADQQAFAAQEYNDATWNWGAWGPGFGRGWAWGPGFGW